MQALQNNANSKLILVAKYTNNFGSKKCKTDFLVNSKFLEKQILCFLLPEEKKYVDESTSIITR